HQNNQREPPEDTIPDDDEGDDDSRHNENRHEQWSDQDDEDQVLPPNEKNLEEEAQQYTASKPYPGTPTKADSQNRGHRKERSLFQPTTSLDDPFASRTQ